MLQIAPDNLEARKLLAQVRLRMGHPDAVLELLSPLQADADADVNTLIGLAHLQLGDSGEASSSIREPRRREPPSNRARQLDLAASYLQAREPIARPSCCCAVCRMSMAKRAARRC